MYSDSAEAFLLFPFGRVKIRFWISNVEWINYLLYLSNNLCNQNTQAIVIQYYAFSQMVNILKFDKSTLEKVPSNYHVPLAYKIVYHICPAICFGLTF